MLCPRCHRDVWLYDSNTWTCKEGHHTPFDDRAPALEDLAPPVRVWPRRVALTFAVLANDLLLLLLT